MSFNAKTFLFATSALGMAYASPTLAQDSAQADDNASSNDIIVTAQRVEQKLQDVPISITVFSQDQLTNNNISNVKDIAAFTPGLQVQNRYGSDSSNFSIRGFTQEQRTTATVGTYFADVVAPRGSGASFGGDGAGPGSLFDLQNIQVLKGPQGTLFGRNSTGGAVLLVPRKPTDKVEGYLEGSIGDYNMWRMQGVLNVPVSDTFRLRIGVDRMKRDGYLKNIGRFGDGVSGQHGLGNTDYIAVRASAVLDLTPDIENYTVASYTHSKNNGNIPSMIACFPGVSSAGIPFGNMACAQLARENAVGPWTVSSRLPNSGAIIDQFQITNTLSWKLNDSLTLKNIVSYGEFKGVTNLDLFGNYFIDPAVPSGTETSPGQVTGFAFTSANPLASGKTNAQSTFVYELRLQGELSGGRFHWQTGFYMEIDRPLGYSGVQTSTFGACADVTTLNCVTRGGFSLGTVNFSLSKTLFTDYAGYGQASYDLSDKLTLTGGIRYTWDKQTSDLILESIATGGATAGTFICANPIGTGSPPSSRFPIAIRETACQQRIVKATSAPTWLIGLDFKPVDDVLIYAKYTRGYRQGGVSMFSPDTSQPYNAETVDTYEIGTKTSWRGAVPGSFNISAFYNDFKNQQILAGVTDNFPNPPGIPTAGPSASIVNFGKSRLYGLEAELNLRPFDGFRMGVAYGYLNTKLTSATAISLPPGSPYDTITQPILGDTIPNAQPHKLSINAEYTLPLPESVGKVTLGGAMAYHARYRVVVDGVRGSGVGFVPSTTVVNLNLNWEEVAGSPIDASFFVTNVTNTVIYLNVNDNQSRGFVTSLVGEPRMFGFRLKYRFGN